MFIWIFVHLRNPINVRQIELLTIWLYSEGGEDRFVVVQHLWCRKICQIVCRVSRKWMESKFLDQDVDVVSLANKGIVTGCFVGRNYNKILMETGKLTDNIRVTKNGLGSGVDRMFQSSDSAMKQNTLFPYITLLSHFRGTILDNTHWENRFGVFISQLIALSLWCFYLTAHTVCQGLLLLWMF